MLAPNSPLRARVTASELELSFGTDSHDGMDQTPAIDPSEPEAIPAYDMDQTRSW